MKLKTVSFTFTAGEGEKRWERRGGNTDLGISLTKYVQDRYEENYKTLMSEIKEDLNKGERVCVFGYEDLIFWISQFSIWSIDSMQSQSEPQQVTLWLLVNWFQTKAKEPE